jgi:hypothetical protein
MDVVETEQEPRDEVPFTDLEIEVIGERLLAEQNFGGAVLAGGIAALAGGTVWAVLTVQTQYQIVWMAIGMAFLVGLAVRVFGKGFDSVFGAVGAVWSVVGCLIGNLLAVYGFIGQHEGASVLSVMAAIEPWVIPKIMIETFEPIDLAFYGCAIYLGYRYSFREMTEEDIEGFLEERKTATLTPSSSPR